jgi:hypothetical protein
MTHRHCSRVAISPALDWRRRQKRGSRGRRQRDSVQLEFLSTDADGDLANAVETVVADHVVSHLWEHTYLLWFDDQLARWHHCARQSIGGQGVWLHDGMVWIGSDRKPDSRTAVAIDRSRKLLFLAGDLPISGPRTGCWLMAGTRARWRLAKAPKAFCQDSYMAGGGRWRRTSG